MADDRQAANVLRLIYGALVASILLYAAVLEFVTVDETAVFPEELLPVLLAVAATTSAMSFFVPALLLRRRDGGAPVAQQRFTAFILRWSLSESVAIFGLLMGLLNGPRTWVLVFFGWALVLMAVHHPFGRSGGRV